VQWGARVEGRGSRVAGCGTWVVGRGGRRGGGSSSVVVRRLFIILNPNDPVFPFIFFVKLLKPAPTRFEQTWGDSRFSAPEIQSLGCRGASTR
jgi:hypothetical protein